MNRAKVVAGALALTLAISAATVVAQATGQSLVDQFDNAVRAGNLAEAERIARRGLAEAERARSSQSIGEWSYKLGYALHEQGRLAEAETLYKKALPLIEQTQGASSAEAGGILNNMGNLCYGQGRYRESIELHTRAVEIRRRVLGENHLDTALNRTNLANAHFAVGNYGDAERLMKQALTEIERQLGRDHSLTADTLHNLGNIIYSQRRYDEAEPVLRRALALREKQRGAEHALVADTLVSLAAICEEQGRNAEAEPTLKRALAIQEKVLGREHVQVADSLNNLGNIYANLGRLADAEVVRRRALAVYEKTVGLDDPRAATTMNNLANGLYSHGRYEEAAAMHERALAIRQKRLSPNHLDVAWSLNNLANAHQRLANLPRAESLHREALAIRERVLGAESADVATSLTNLANIYDDQLRFDEAEPLLARALAIYEKTLGKDHPNTATTLHNLANVRCRRGRYADAEPAARRALAIRQRAGVGSGELSQSHAMLAKCDWNLDRKDEAIGHLRTAMDLAERQRGQAGGGEQERATLFGEYAFIYELMVDWQFEKRQAAEAFEAMERARARSLLDEMAAAGVDLLVGLPAAERNALRHEESSIASRVSQLQQRLTDALADPAVDASRRADLERQLAEAREALYDHWRKVRTNSLVYRDLLTVDAAVPSLADVQSQLARTDGLLLAYLLGTYGGYVVSVTADSIGIDRLVVDEAAAKALGVYAGPLSADRLKMALTRTDGAGALQRLSRPSTALTARGQLASLWRILVPEPIRQALVDGKFGKLVVVPDGPLALLPFETLVTDLGSSGQAGATRYLLDANMPIIYAPSATVLLNLEQRSSGAPGPASPVLTVADPTYPRLTPPPANEALLSMLAARSRYASLRGALPPLPFTNVESTWLKAVFDPVGLTTERLSKAAATEAAVRAAAPSREIVHLACHGLTDSEYGNFFGALALTPGARAAVDPRDDGFLTLAEIYEMDLKSCELAILSACETNYGPQQQGEGTWALSRGFVVAGARRVVASNWLVDDEAAASLVSYFCGGLAVARKSGAPVDYARSLHDAKLWVRQQEKWRNPYYWGTFVLVGPE